MALIGYARVSSDEVDVGPQVQALARLGCDPIHREVGNCGSEEGREVLQSVLAFLRADDILVITNLDRLAGSVQELSAIVEFLERRQAGLRILEPCIDTRVGPDTDFSSESGRAFLRMLGVFAQFESDIRSERRKAAAVKLRGRHRRI